MVLYWRVCLCYARFCDCLCFAYGCLCLYMVVYLSLLLCVGLCFLFLLFMMGYELCMHGYCCVLLFMVVECGLGLRMVVYWSA